MKVKNDTNSVELCPLDEIKQTERIRLMANDLVAGMSRKSVIDKYEALWGCCRQTAINILDETLVYLSQQYEIDREVLKTLNSAKIEELYADATVNQKLKIIDLLNKMHNIYEQNINVNAGDEEFKFDIGLKSKNIGN